MWKKQCTWLLIWLFNIKLCNSTGKLSIRLLEFKSNYKINNGDCCDSIRWCSFDKCDLYFELCVTEVTQANCNAGKFRTKVLGEGSLNFPRDLGGGERNPLEYSFQRWQGFTLRVDAWDYDSGFWTGASDLVDNLHLDISGNPARNSALATSKTHSMKSESSPNERYLKLEIKIFCDDNYLVPDCVRKCVPRDDAGGHYTCDYVNGRVICNHDWYGDYCTTFCKPRDDALGHYTCDNWGAKICAADWFGENCSTFCQNTDDFSGHYTCDILTGSKVCLANWYGNDCLVFCKTHAQYTCNRTSGEKICLGDWYGDECTKYCSPQDDVLLGHFTCDITGEKVCLPGWRGVNCTLALTGLITCRDKLELWVDGVWYGPDNGNWNVPWSFQISANATLMAVKAEHHGIHGGILGSLSSGVVTDRAWRCTNRFYSNWMTMMYDDSTWARAKTYGYNGATLLGRVAGIADNANWIWTPMNDDVVYCRRALAAMSETSTELHPSFINSQYLSKTKKHEPTTHIRLYPTPTTRTITSKKYPDAQTFSSKSSLLNPFITKRLTQKSETSQESKEKQATLETPILKIPTAITTSPTNQVKTLSKPATALAIEYNTEANQKIREGKIIASAEHLNYGSSLQVEKISISRNTETSIPASAVRSGLMPSRIVTRDIGQKNFTLVVKLQNQWQNDSESNLEERIKMIYKNKTNYFLCKEVKVRIRKECKNALLLDVHITYFHENGLFNLSMLILHVEALIKTQLNATEVSAQHELSLDCNENPNKASISKDSLILVCFVAVTVVIAITVGICIKMKQKKRLLITVAPSNNHLLNTDRSNQRSQLYGVPKDHSTQINQELLQMGQLS